MNNKLKYAPLLSVDPTVRGCGYTIFEGPRNPIDWGMIHVRLAKNKRTADRVRKLIDVYQPNAIVIEDCTQSLRCKRVKNLLDNLCSLAKKKKSECTAIHAHKYWKCLGVLENQQNMKSHKQLPSGYLSSHHDCHARESGLNPSNEQYAIFDAAALAIVHMYLMK